MKKRLLPNSYLSIWIAIMLCSFLLIFSFGCSSHYQYYQVEYFDVFDTHVTFSGYATSEAEFDKYADIIHDELFRLHRLFDIYHDYDGIANLKTVNDSAGILPVHVDSSIIELLNVDKNAYEISDGTVNIAMGSVLSLWHQQRIAATSNTSSARLPIDSELKEAATHCSLDDIEIDDEAHQVFLRDKKMSLDVGAIAKGFAAQSAIEEVKKAGFISGILDAGGNVCIVGKPMDSRKNWRIGIQNPKLVQSNVLDAVPIDHDSSIVTSGSYQRYFIVDGHSYNHIIDPSTLYPAQNVEGVTVIHPSSITSEVLSTAAFILPFEKALTLIELEGAEAIWVYADGTVKTSNGYSGQLADRQIVS